MPIWVFIFTRASHPLESARVAAKGRDQAWLLLQAFAGLERRLPGVIVSNGGKMDTAAPAMLSAIRRSDRAQLVEIDN